MPSSSRIGFATGLMKLLLGNPTASVGGLVMTATSVAIFVNAMLLQQHMHPAPLFVGTRPVPSAEQPNVSRNVGEQSGPLDQMLGGRAAAPDAAPDTTLVADIQTQLAALGYYQGSVDGLTGPQTSQALLGFQRAFGLTPTGDPSEGILKALKAVVARAHGQQNSELTDVPAAVDPMTVASLPSDMPLPPPKPRELVEAQRADIVAPGARPAAPILPPASATAAQDNQPASISDLIANTAMPPARPQVEATTPERHASIAQPAAGDPRLALIQKSLADQGFGPLPADGQMTAQTRDAIKQFEAYYGLPVTGEINERFLAQLIKVGGLVTH